MSKRILAIEDEQAILDNIVEILEIGGAEPYGALDGPEGLKLVREIQPDLILCDINMPQMDGYSVLMKLKSDPATSFIPFVFLTAFSDRDFMRRGMNMGANDYLTKPFTPDELLDMVDAQIEQAKERENARQQEIETLRQNIMMALPHELRTPLTGILTCSDMLLLDFEEGMEEMGRIEQMMRIINKSAYRLQHVIENYLIYAQIELYMQSPEQSPDLKAGAPIHNLNTALQFAVEEAETRNARPDFVQYNAVDALPSPVSISEVNLKKILLELLDNAVKFTKPEDKVCVETNVQDGRVELSVIDEGRGMSPEEVQRIGAYMQFNRHFYEQQGLGLGLVIARRLTELHGGQLHIESAPEQGTTVRLSLPLA